MLRTFMSCLRELVRVCLAEISLTAFSHRIFKHGTIVAKLKSEIEKTRHDVVSEKQT